MLKGLTLTLLTVAVACLGFNAMSMAPVVSDIPDVIIGDLQNGTQSNNFVYPDAIDLNTKVTDDNTTAGGILWSYSGTGNYRVNNVVPIGSGDPNAPGLALITSADDPGSTDTNRRTITFRSNLRSPAASLPGPFADPGATSDTEVMTLIASDGTTYTMSNNFMVYIDNDSPDALSGSAATDIYTRDFTQTVGGWVSYTDLAIGGVVSQSRVTTGAVAGLCVDTSLAGVNIGGWQSEAASTTGYTTVDLTANCVYQVRLTVGTNATAGHTPVWSVVHQQFVNVYGGDNIFFDNFGGANAPAPNNTASGLTDKNHYEVWVTPAAVSTAQWNSNFFTGVADTENGFRLSLRVLDVDGANYDAENDSGRLCWKDIVIRKYDVSALTVASTPYSVTAFSKAVPDQGASPDANAWTVTDYVANSTVDFTSSAGDITITPVGTGWQSATGGSFITLAPGDVTGFGTATNAQLDNYPVTWESDKLLKTTFSVGAVDATAATNAPDFLRVGMDVPSNELIGYAYITNMYAGKAMPKAGAGQPYTNFMYSHSASASAATQDKTMRPRMELGCNNDFTETQNTGGVRVYDVKVEKLNGRSN